MILRTLFSILSLSWVVASVSYGQPNVQRPVSAYLDTLPSGAKSMLILGCGHFTPASDEDVAYYSNVDHTHRAAYCVDAGEKVCPDLMGCLGTAEVDQYLFSQSCWDVVYAECLTNVVLTTDLVCQIARSLKPGRVFITASTLEGEHSPFLGNTFVDYVRPPLIYDLSNPSVESQDRQNKFRQLAQQHGFQDGEFVLRWMQAWVNEQWFDGVDAAGHTFCQAKKMSRVVDEENSAYDPCPELSCYHPAFKAKNALPSGSDFFVFKK